MSAGVLARVAKLETGTEGHSQQRGPTADAFRQEGHLVRPEPEKASETPAEFSRAARCGHGAAPGRRGPVGSCQRCRALAAAAVRLRQAAEALELDADLSSLATELRAIAADPAGRNAALVVVRTERAAAAERIEFAERPSHRDRVQRGLQDRRGRARTRGRVLQHSAGAAQ